AGDRAGLACEVERQVLSRARRATVLKYTAEQYDHPATAGKPLATPDVKAVTTLGLLAEYDPATNVWKRLTLAMPKDRNNPLELAGAGGLDDPDGIRGPLRAALQTNALFMVVTGAEFETFGKLLNPIIDIEGWRFNLDPKVWDQHGTILLFKFNERPLADL